MEMSQENQSDTEKGDTTSPPRHKRKRSSPKRSTECVTISLYGELAELWNEERGILSDTQFVEQLLRLRERYKWLKSSCKCGASLEVESGDSGGENICPESDEEILNLADSNLEPTQPVKASRQIVKIEVEDTDFVEFYDSDDDEFFLEDELRKGGRKRKGHGPVPCNRVCEICCGIIARETPKRVHVLSEHFTVFANCKVCRNSQGSKNIKCFVALDEFYDHLKSVHNSRDNKCPFCRPRSANPSKQLLYTDSNSLRWHILKRHPQNLMCRCKECCVGADETQVLGGSLIKAVSVKSHIALKHSTRKQKKIPCPQCSQLITPASLQKHIKNMHEEKIQDENNLCDVCGKYFVHLKQHKLSVHKGKESWSFKCETCGKPFAKRYNLEVHSRIHTGEKPFVCDLCGKAFCQKVELRSHIKNNHSTPKKKQRDGTKKNPPVEGASSTKQDAGILETTRLKSDTKEIPAEAENELSATLSESNVVQSSSDSIQPVINPQTSTQQFLYAVIPEYTGTDNATILTSLAPNLTYISIEDKNQTQEILNWVNRAVSEGAPPANE